MRFGKGGDIGTRAWLMRLVVTFCASGLVGAALGQATPRGETGASGREAVPREKKGSHVYQGCGADPPIEVPELPPPASGRSFRS